MLTCKKCGNENPLGRVFCGACGGKLDLSGMNSEAVAETQHVNFFRQHLRTMAMSLLLIPVALVAAAFWPRMSPIGQQGTAAGTSAVNRQLGVLASLGSGRSVSIEVQEKDINGYFQFSRIKKTPVSSLSVQCGSGAMAVRMVQPLMRPFKLGSIAVEPKISYDVVCVPMGRQINIGRASIGHLAAVGPLRHVAVRPLIRFLKGGREEKVLQQVSEIRVEEGKLILVSGGR